MGSSYFKLKPNVIAEPLIDHWYAWAYLISPVTYSLILSNSHIPILRSYLNSPHIHNQALNYSKLLGGPFVGSRGSDYMDSVKKLLADHEKDDASILRLANILKEINIIIKAHVEKNGPVSFVNVYKTFPDEIRGLIELVYDANNFPSLRIVEALFYKSIYYDVKRQSVLFYLSMEDHRDFILSTPRFKKNDEVILNLPFSSKIYDKIFLSRTIPIPGEELKKLYEEILLTNNDLVKEDFFSMFDSCVNAHMSQRSGIDNEKNKKIKITYIGHACVLLESNSFSILIDPLIPYNTQTSTVTRYSYNDLPETIDYVLITHSHKDHAVLETLLQIRHKVKNIIVPDNVIGAIQDVSLKLFLENCGFSNVSSLKELELVDFDYGSILALPSFGEHADLNIQSKLSYNINFFDQNILFLSDSKNQEDFLYKRLSKILPEIDYMFIGMECEGAPLSWLYGPIMLDKISRSANQSRRLDGSDADQAIELISILKCKNVFVYAMAHEPWMNFINPKGYNEESKQMQEARKFINMCLSFNIKARILYGSEIL